VGKLHLQKACMQKNSKHVHCKSKIDKLFLFQANYKIIAARLHYEIYALTQRLRLTAIRVEDENAVRYIP